VKTIDWKAVLKSPQAAISFAATAVAVAGTAGIINTDLSGALQTLLSAVLGVVVAVGHSTVQTKTAAKKSAPAVTRDNNV
jgi:mannitol/fructose-specific phosphotransferase system IIA component